MCIRDRLGVLGAPGLVFWRILVQFWNHFFVFRVTFSSLFFVENVNRTSMWYSSVLGWLFGSVLAPLYPQKHGFSAQNHVFYDVYSTCALFLNVRCLVVFGTIFGSKSCQCLTILVPKRKQKHSQNLYKKECGFWDLKMSNFGSFLGPAGHPNTATCGQ